MPEIMEGIMASILRIKGLRGMVMMTALLVAWMLAGCAASRSQMTGIFNRVTEKNFGTEKVSVFLDSWSSNTDSIPSRS